MTITFVTTMIKMTGFLGVCKFCTGQYWKYATYIFQLQLLLLCFLPFKKVVGANDDEGPPVPIPNTEVKLIRAEDTCLETDRENR